MTVTVDVHVCGRDRPDRDDPGLAWCSQCGGTVGAPINTGCTTAGRLDDPDGPFGHLPPDATTWPTDTPPVRDPHTGQWIRNLLGAQR